MILLEEKHPPKPARQTMHQDIQQQQKSDPSSRYEGGRSQSKQSGLKSTTTSTVRMRRGGPMASRRLLLVPIALLSLFYVAGTASAQKGAASLAHLRSLEEAADPSAVSAPATGSNHDTQDSQQHLSKGELPKIHIDAIEPEAGPTSGETRVLVRGGPFAQYQQMYPKPMCKFGHDDMIVEATYVLCTSAPQWVQEKEARHRDKNDTCLQCDNSPASAKSEIVPFTISLTGDFQDVTNSIPFRYYPPTRIFSIYPRYGPKDGETVVQVWGENFLNFDENTRCAFGTKSVQATFINSNYMICVAPFSDVVEKPIPFTVSLNNQQNSRDSISYWYYSFPAITELIPDRGPDTGGTKVLLRGRNFNPFNGLTIDNANDTFCMFEDLGKVPAVVVNSTKAYCLSPPSYVLRQSIVEITLNNQQYTDDNNIFYYYRPPYLFDTNPREGPVSGGNKVIAVGSNFQETKNIKCKFNTTVVPGKFLSSSEIECVAPPSENPGFVPFSIALELDLFSSPLQYLYYEKPVVDSIEPICGPDYGYTQITVKGKNFIDMGRDQVLCIFNKTIFTNATIMDSETIKCDSPSLLNAQGYSKMTDHMLWYDVEITVDGGRERAAPAQRFNYYRDPKILDIRPDSGPMSGGTKVQVVGSGFNQQGACNKTLRFSVFETKPISETNDTLAVVASPQANVPDAVVVSIALNGQQFIRDLTIHKRDPENTFEYYLDPVVTSFEPNAGPSVGGTQMIISGYGFMPRRDDSGNVDHKRNKMWIRFVDPDSLQELAPRYQVKPEDLTDDQAVWYTPALSPDTKALMQISLNNQDWHSIPLVQKTYSFTYYESPHVTRLNPPYGPVKHKGDLVMDIEGSNFKCPEPKCADLLVRFGEPGTAIYQKGQRVSDSLIRVKVPKYSKPEVLRLEVTVNGKDWSNDGKTYGYFDPYVLRAEPALISVDGTTKIRIIGFGFVNSTTSKSMVRSPSGYTLVCQGGSCVREAVFINQNMIQTTVHPQALINYKETDQGILWDPMSIDASIHGGSLSDFTDNGVQIFFYEEPEYKELTVDESPANIQTSIYVITDFKKNPIDRLKKYANISCRFKGEEGQVAFSPGEMTSYPLERGKPNAVLCRSPKWDLKGKSFENAKLDIALNGQDFKGNMDFLFSQDIIIHRTVPMAGPVQGKSKTRIIGTGFKPARSNVNLKWGVLSSDTIPKSQVQEYIYYKNQFENMIEGSEELKSYIYEASQFPRVDTTLFEEQGYNSVYMNSAEIDTWTQTNGGPFYVEVGRNVEIKFNTRVNVTVKLNNTNSTNVPSTQVVEQSILKTWIYYEFEPSSVEYYYYKDCIVKDINPHSGLILGGTKVAVSGAWFKYMPEYGVVPHCKFGNKIVRAQFDSTVRIVCIAPPGEELGVLYPFEVSLNGVDWTDSGMKFSYYDVPTLYNIQPIIGPESGGTLIYINGTNFFNMSNPVEFHCKFTPINLPIPPKKMPGIYVNQSTVMCASPGGWGQGVAVKLQVTFNGIDYDNSGFTFTFFSISRAFPRSGPSDGTGGDIIIEGNGFRNDSGALCKLNNTVYEPTSVTWKQIRCPMPKAASGDQYFGNVDLSVSPNGNDWHNFLGGFQYYPQPIVDDIFPKQGPSLGVGIINFYGSGFRNDYNLIDMACKLGDSVGKAVYISDQHIKCVVEDMQLVNEGEYLPAQLALNRYSWTVLGNSTFYLPYGIDQIYPNSGPTSGVTDVIIQGKGFVNEDGLGTPRCRFGTPANFAIVEAQILSYERITCKAPADYKPSLPGTFPIDIPLSIALTTDENDPWTESSHKFRFYEQPLIAKCDPCEVDVGSIREIYVWAEENSQFFEPVPSIQRSGVDLEAQENGLLTMASSLGGITCQFGRFGETQAIYINSTVIKCITPVVEDEPDSIYREIVKLTVAMNGVDHEEQTSEIEFTFVGTGSYLGFWPFIIGTILIALLIVALIQFSDTIFKKISLEDAMQYFGNNSRANGGAGGQEAGVPHVVNMGGGVMVPRGRSDWNAERTSVTILERATGQQLN